MSAVTRRAVDDHLSMLFFLTLAAKHAFRWQLKARLNCSLLMLLHLAQGKDKKYKDLKTELEVSQVLLPALFCLQSRASVHLLRVTQAHYFFIQM
jgi:hypothetical protein